MAELGFPLTLKDVGELVDHHIIFLQANKYSQYTYDYIIYNKKFSDYSEAELMWLYSLYEIS